MVTSDLIMARLHDSRAVDIMNVFHPLDELTPVRVCLQRVAVMGEIFHKLAMADPVVPGSLPVGGMT